MWRTIVLILLTACQTAPKRDQERAQLHMRIGVGYLAQGAYPQAMGELLEAERLDHKNFEILNNLGLAYQVRGRLDTAEVKFRESLKIEPRFSEARNNLGRTLIDQGRPGEALPLLEQVENDLTYTTPDKTWLNLGMAYFQLGEFAKAEAKLARALEVHRQNCVASYYYGRTLHELHKLEAAAVSLDQAVEFCRANRFEDPLYFAGVNFYALGERDKSRARFEELVGNYPKSKYVARAEGMLRLNQP